MNELPQISLGDDILDCVERSQAEDELYRGRTRKPVTRSGSGTSSRVTRMCLDAINYNREMDAINNLGIGE